MREKIIMLTITLAACAFILNCGGGRPVADVEKIPEWYINPPQAEDAIYGAGDAVKQSLALAKEAADARARDAIARTIEVKVSNMLKNFMQESGLANDAEALEFTESVSKQVANVVLNGCKIVKRNVVTEGNLYHIYSLAEYNLSSLVQETLEQARRNKALYNEAKARMSFEELEKEIQKLEKIGNE
ncbi:MAG: LPP20 family lipoprotein [Candidatus Marinimicrobia bacterium]|nr:LPP20 family lipoprotein [Candidatus Neomarinimicrobiota bacterium]